MKLESAKDSLFAVLLRSPWWISVAVAAGIAAVARLCCRRSTASSAC